MNLAASPVSALGWNPLCHLLAIGYRDGVVRMWQHPFGSKINGEIECKSI
jgi:hypothetical protein